MKTPKPGTYVLKSTYGKLQEKLRLVMKGWDFSEAAMKEKYTKQTEVLNQLSKDYNMLVVEHRELKEGNKQTIDHRDLVISENRELKKYKETAAATIHAYCCRFKNFESLIFWLKLWAWTTTATTLLLIGYHIYRAIQ